MEEMNAEDQHERVASEAKLGVLEDHIPLKYKYTAGVAGDRFLRLLKQGKIQASRCERCDKLYLPPKIFCKDCFSQLNEWKDIPEEGAYLYSFTTVRKGKKEREKEEGEEEEKVLVALVKYDGVEGGLLGTLKKSREEPKVGMRVRPVFRDKAERKGDLSDIEYFERVSP